MTSIRRLTPLGGLDMNMQAKLRARRPTRPVVRKRIIPPKPGMPAAPTVDPLWTKANNTVMGFMNPMLSRLAAQRVAAETNARSVNPQHVAALQGQLQAGAGNMDASFNRGIVASSAVNDALANRLNSQGGNAQAELTAKLAQIGAQDTGQIAQTYQGASNAGFATGSADLQKLIAERANVGAYQAKLPGIAALQGNRDLQQALSEMRENFGQQEKELTDQASEQSFGLWDKLRGEKREDSLNSQQAMAAQQELYVKQKMALQALAATATTKAQERQFEAAQKQLELNNAKTIAEIKANASMYGADTRAATAAAKPAKVAPAVGPANQKYISDGKGGYKPNPNYNKNSGAPKGASGSQTAVTYNEIVKRLVNSGGGIRDSYRNSATPDKDIHKVIIAGLKLRKIPYRSEEGKRIRREVFAYLNGRNGYKSPKWGLG